MKVSGQLVFDFNPQISQITRIPLITLRAMRNLQGLIPRSLPRGGSLAQF